MSSKFSFRKGRQDDKTTNYDSYEKFTSKMKRQQKLAYRTKKEKWQLAEMDIKDLREYIIETEY